MHFITAHLGRFLFALPFLVFGVVHLVRPGEMAAMVPEFLPGPGVMYVYTTGALQMIASLAILARFYDRYAAIGLAILLLLFVLLIHMPYLPNQAAVGNALKDIALAGAALIYAGTGRK